MIQRFFRLGALLAILCSLLSLPGLAAAQGAAASAAPHTPPDVSNAVAHAASPPLRDSPPLREEHGPDTKPLHLIPRGQTARQSDPVVQSSPGVTVSASGGLSFAGVGQGDYSFVDNAAPPDTNLAVGDTQVVQWVNESFAVFDKSTGNLLYGPAAGNTLWKSLGGDCATHNDGDPIAQFDKAAHRWVMTQFSLGSTYLQCVAVSTTNDATGSWNLYSFSYGSTQMPDYPKLGVWPDAYYVSYNIFNNGSSFAGAKLCAFNRSAMLAGQSATQQCFQLSTAYGGLLPADLDGSMSPPAGSPELYVNYGSNSLNLWQFHADWSNTGNTTLAGPIAIPVAAFTAACNGGGTCIPQPGTSEKLDSLADRLMYRLAYRNFGDHEALVVNHSVTTPNGQVGIRWYELRNPTGSTFGQASATNLPAVYQKATYAPDSNYRWMGSIAMDHVGDIAVGFSESNSTTMYPSIYFTGRTPTDALNTMEAETLIKAGAGSQLPNLSRWGDYSAMSVDPTDDCTLWYTTEYLKSSGTFNWSTWIYSFKFPGCSTTTTAPAAPTNLTANYSPNNVIGLSWTDNATNATSYGVDRSVNGGQSWTTLTTSLAANAVSYVDTALSEFTTYQYRVYAINSAGSSAYSNTASATTPLARPTNLSASAVSPTQINLSWTDNSSYETGYNIERSTDATNFTQVAQVGANVATYQDTNLVASTTYYYRVAAYNGTSSSAYSTIASATTQSGTTLAAPSSLSAKTVSSSEIDLSWTDNSSNETGFYVERSTDNVSFSQIGQVGANVVTYSDTASLTPSTTYYYRVRAYASGVASAYSNVASATTQAAPTVPAAPSNLTATAVSKSQINLSWTDNSNNETGFWIERSLNGTSGWTQEGPVGSDISSYSDASGLSASTFYYYRVYAYNANGNSGYSNTVKVRTLRK